MDTNSVISELKGLTLDFVNGKRNRKDTVKELHDRIDPNEIYNMPENVPERLFITEVFVSLNNLTEEGFATSKEEMIYLAECFEGKREFKPEEIRLFTIGQFENDK